MASSKPSMMRQWADIKRETPDCIVLFRLGDFYEAFNEDAGKLADACDVTLTSRPVKKGQRVPMAGVPYHSVDGYIAQLVRAGHKVAIVEQRGGDSNPEKRARMSRVVSDDEPDETGPTQPGLPGTGVKRKRKPKILAREVVRVVTPGTLLEGDLLEADANNFLAAMVRSVDEGRLGLAHLDISTGEFATTEVDDPDDRRHLDELARLRPAELLVPEPSDDEGHDRIEGLQQRLADIGLQTVVMRFPAWQFEAENARRTLLEHFGAATLEPYGCADKPLAAGAAAAALSYASQSQRGAVSQVTRLSTYHGGAHMALDAVTRRNLELTTTIRGDGKRGTLLWVLDRTSTAMGGRKLRGWLDRPLVDRGPITERHDRVEALAEAALDRRTIRDRLSGIPDIERLINRVLGGYAGPRELRRMAEGLRTVESLGEFLDRSELPEDIRALCQDDVDGIAERIETAIAEEPPATLGVMGIIRRGHSEDLDRIHDSVADAKEWIDSLEDRERKRTGIQRLKVGYNKVFGYYLNVPKSQADDVPEEWQRKQTLVDSERFITPALKERESEVLNAEERILELERQLYHTLIEGIAHDAPTVLSAAREVARLDVLSALAETAVVEDWSRPELDERPVLDISSGRHPVVERMQRDKPFVPNDLALDVGEIALLTGPNMAGKSTVGRQAAIIALLAQIGSFVPADHARVGLVDRIFTRIGAQDEIAAGQSTFMVEMVETGNILHHATPRSLVILDELGRGTSTYDGIAIAWAVLEKIHDDERLGCRTIFATHYHELTVLAERLARVKNLHMAVADEGGQVVFLHRVEPGTADRSYGVHVAELAGLPVDVTRRAWEMLERLERQGGIERTAGEPGRRRREDDRSVDAPSDERHDPPPGRAGMDDGVAGTTVHPAVSALRALDVQRLTPIDALNRLAEIRSLAEDEGRPGDAADDRSGGNGSSDDGG